MALTALPEIDGVISGSKPPPPPSITIQDVSFIYIGGKCSFRLYALCKSSGKMK